MRFTVLLALSCFVVGLKGEESVLLAQRDKFVQKQSQTNVHHVYNKCDASECNSVRGPRGPRGFKGEPGKADVPNYIKNQIKKLKSDLARVNEVINNLPKTDYCYMGVKDYEIPNHSITASSYHDATCQPYHARLDNNAGAGRNSAWCARRNTKDVEYLQVDLGAEKSVAGIVTQGRGEFSQWVTSYKISCGTTPENMLFVMKHGNPIFRGNFDMNTKVNSMFEKPLTCRYVRVYPMTFNKHMSMRLELIHGMCSGLFH